jgi:predicted P-loop ATPase/GTPase
MMKIIPIINALVLSLFLASCSSLQSPCIIGEKVIFPESAVGTETVWEVDDEIYHIRIISTNAIAGAVVEWDSESQTHKTTTGELVLSELNGKQFLNYKEDDLYHIHRIVPSGNDSIVFLSIDAEEMKKHISTGRVESEKGSTYFLKGTKEEIDKFISENVKAIFDSEDIIVAKLISGEL